MKMGNKSRIHVFQHVPFEDLGSIAPWLRQQGLYPQYTRFFAGDSLPVLAKDDALIIMGGPMSVNDGKKFPWLIPEKKIIREAISRGIPVLGICLGAQLIASALGASVYGNAVKEIGWLPVQSVSKSDQVFQFPAKFMPFHWHGETFDLPAGAILLASSAGCIHQSFQIKKNVIGLQFHLEITTEIVNGLIQNCGSELIPGPFIQTEQELRKVSAPVYRTCHALMNDILAYLI
jgi:GMP synthase-like glutamine amidotransferase